MSAKNRAKAPYAFDDYQSPAWCVKRMLERLSLPSGKWIDPCAGDGTIIKATRDLIPQISWSAIEIQESYREPLQALGDVDVEIADVLEYWKGIDIDPARKPYDVAATNPPYTLALPVLKLCRKLSRHVVLLLRTGFLEGGGSKATEEREAFLRDDMPDVYVLPNRPRFRDGGSDSATYAWMHWTPVRRSEGICGRLAVTPKHERTRGDREPVAAE